MLITHDKVYELGYAECSKSYGFHGGKEYSQKQIQDMLGLSMTVPTAPCAGKPVGIFGEDVETTR